MRKRKVEEDWVHAVMGPWAFQVSQATEIHMYSTREIQKSPIYRGGN